MTTRPLEIDDIARIVAPAETAISPDGALVVFSRSATVEGITQSSLWLVSEGSDPRALTSGPADFAPRFSADGASILFTRTTDGLDQLFLLPVGGGEARAITGARDFPLGVASGQLSADGIRVAVSAPVSRTATVPGGADPIVIDRLGFKRDGVGWVGSVRHHLFVIELANGAVRRITDGDWNTGSPSWSPDGRWLAFTAAIDEDADVELTHGAYIVEVDSKRVTPRRVGEARSVDGPLAWTPDGTALIAIGSAAPRVGNAGLLFLALDGGTADVNLTGSFDRNVMAGAPAYPGGSPGFTADGGEIVFCLRDRGWTQLHAVTPDGASSRALVAGEHEVVSALSVASGAARASFVLTTQQSFGEVATIDLASGAVTVLTSLTASALAGVELYEAEQREFTISDGTVVHGWLLAAPETVGAAPLLLDIHGGPHNAWSGVADDIHFYQQLLAARGWRVLMVNPRGSDGYGDEFYRAVNGGWGPHDERDFLEPLDALVAEGLADPDRLALTGYSYGGFSTCSLTASTPRFAAAVAGGLLCNFAGLAANSEGAAFFSEMTAGVKPLGHHRELIDASPISRVTEVMTPTLILHGADDDICPVGQAQEWFSALRLAGVPSRLVVYPGGSHLFILNGPISQRIDYHQRLVEWVERYARPRSRTREIGQSPAALGVDFWRRRLDVLSARYGVVGAQFGIVRLGETGDPFERTTASSGVLDITTGVPTTDDALFQIGSITKVWTTTLIMQLADEGRLDLDAPVRSVLPDFALADDAVAAAVTIRQLLNHTSGIDGDLFTDTGTGDDCVERYVASLRTAEQVHPIGERFSYCNSGFVVAGRIIEVLRDMTWDAALQKYILVPMGLGHTITLTADAPRFATATGHNGFGEESQAVPVWPIARSMGPAGLIASSIGDVLTFAETALRDGIAPNGTRILSEASAAAMREEQVSLRDYVPSTTGWGLGWFLEDWNGTFVYGHDGGTIGQRAYLRIFHDDGFAIALLTSGGQADGLYRELCGDAASAESAARIPAALEADEGSDPSDFGTLESARFASGGTELQLNLGEDGPALIMQEIADVLRTGELPEPTTLGLIPATIAGVWAFTAPDMAGWAQFRPLADGAYLGYRYVPRAGDS